MHKQLINELHYFQTVVEFLEDLPNYRTLYEPEWTYKNVMGHPDVVIGTTIYDVKTTGRFGHMRISTIFQLLGYVALAHKNNIKITHIGVILPCQGIIERVDISGWNSSKYMDILIAKATEKSQLTNISDNHINTFVYIQNFIGSHVPRQTTLQKTRY